MNFFLHRSRQEKQFGMAREQDAVMQPEAQRNSGKLFQVASADAPILV
ncbi:hypothetical protein HNR00_001384 [Methylorubrum rhodinum]|uniref:Uncharacterized protein n=1 Tax=Methylorubrum rhodinum TaxID=29428 RepID=A0A840ZHK2_9HYPH|nr:hypothetical protein [Methylorubrum rhodinum]MBB5756684.1 hypothetical protein [Methylorubrum rhodinum]